MHLRIACFFQNTRSPLVQVGPGIESQVVIETPATMLWSRLTRGYLRLVTPQTCNTLSKNQDIREMFAVPKKKKTPNVAVVDEDQMRNKSLTSLYTKLCQNFFEIAPFYDFLWCTNFRVLKIVHDFTWKKLLRFAGLKFLKIKTFVKRTKTR